MEDGTVGKPLFAACGLILKRRLPSLPARVRGASESADRSRWGRSSSGTAAGSCDCPQNKPGDRQNRSVTDRLLLFPALKGRSYIDHEYFGVIFERNAEGNYPVGRDRKLHLFCRHLLQRRSRNGCRVGRATPTICHLLPHPPGLLPLLHHRHTKRLLLVLRRQRLLVICGYFQLQRPRKQLYNKSVHKKSWAYTLKSS